MLGKGLGDEAPGVASPILRRLVGEKTGDFYTMVCRHRK
jgi:hypothetical protein